MLHFDEAFAGLAAHALRRRIGRDEFRVRGLQLQQLLHQQIEFGVADLGVVEDVVTMLVVADLFAQRFHLARHRGWLACGHDTGKDYTFRGPAARTAGHEGKMYRLRNYWMIAAMVLISLPSLKSQQKPSAPGGKNENRPASSAFTPAPSPQMEKLSKMLLGSWNTSEKFEPSPFMPKGGSGKGTETFHSGPGGLSIIADYQSQSKDLGGSFRGHAILNWNETQKGYQAYWIDSASPSPTILNGDWQG